MDMRIKFTLQVLICLLFFSCEKETEIIEPKTKIEIESKIYYKSDYYEDYFYPVAYYGDTANFSLKYKAKSKISTIELVFKDKNQINERIIKQIRNVSQTDSLSFQIPISENDFSQQYIQTYFSLFIVKFINDEKVVYSDSINVFIKPLETYNYLRLYNIASSNQDCKAYLYNGASSLAGISTTKSSVCLNCTKSDIKDSTFFLVNLPNADFDFINDVAITKDFIHGFYVPQGNNTYSLIEKKINISQIREPKDILNIYNKSTNFKTKFNNVRVGDQFVFKYVYPKPFSYTYHEIPIEQDKGIPHYYSDVYGIFEITHIEDDQLSSDNGGTDNDYIEFRLKSFGKTYRFKK